MLILVLWAVAFLSFLIIEVIRQVNVDLDIAVAQEKNFRALQLAESGLAYGLHSNIEDNDPILDQQMNELESFKVTRGSENGRLNINEILKSGDTTPLVNFFVILELNKSESDAVIDALLDWVDGNDLARLNGAEAEDYEEAGRRKLPRNAFFQTVEEMSYVMGWERVMELNPNWMDHFTVYGDGKLDLLEASSLLIQSTLGLPESQAESFILMRDGPDEEKDTEDDFDFQDNLEYVLDALGLSGDDRTLASEIVTISGNIKRITSVGKVGDFERKLVVVIQPESGNNNRSANRFEFLSWRVE